MDVRRRISTFEIRLKTNLPHVRHPPPDRFRSERTFRVVAAAKWVTHICGIIFRVAKVPSLQRASPMMGPVPSPPWL